MNIALLTNSQNPIIVSNGLVAYWTFNQQSGSLVRDYSIYSNNIATINNPLPTTSLIGQGAISLDGSTQYIGGGYSLLNSIEQHDKSFSMWINKISNSQKGLIDKEFDSDFTGNPGTYGGYGFWTQSNGKLWWWTRSNFDMLDNGSNSITLGAWCHVAMTWNYATSTVNFYINGILNSTLTNTGADESPSTTSSEFEIGNLRNNLNAGQFAFDGQIAQVRIYNRVLSQAEINQLYQSKS